jgi:predicted pyridoxine 5'-phosphate oxidase superfamily flavin-nucleotide-binding protein
MAPQSVIGAPRARFHEGELAVQRRAGVQRVAAKVGRNIDAFVRPEYGEFLSRQAFVVVAARDRAGRLWASLLVGGVGFARVLNDRQIMLAGALVPGDPLKEALARSPARIGVLAIEFDSRLRIRLGGVAQPTAKGLLLTVEEAFTNCPKFIQRRVPIEVPAPRGTCAHWAARALEPRQSALVRRADTFFIASGHPDRGADASHRGGRLGFVEVSDDGGRLVFPDYSGNRMFQTLGNLVVDPRAGLLFLDWSTGTALALTGHARIVWDEDEDEDEDAVRSRPGAERLIEFEITAVHEFERAMPPAWRLIEASPLNPPVRAAASAQQPDETLDDQQGANRGEPPHREHMGVSPDPILRPDHRARSPLWRNQEADERHLEQPHHHDVEADHQQHGDRGW